MTRDVDPVFANAVRAELAARRAPSATAQHRLAVWRSIAVTAAVAAVVIPLSIVALVNGWPRPGGTEAGVAPRVLHAESCDAALTAPFDCRMYVAVGASEGGSEVDWLASHPLHVWFTRQDGQLGIEVVDHVNAVSTPVDLDGDRIWTGKGGSSTTAGCYRAAGCVDDDFADALLFHPARYAFDGVTLVITSGTRLLRLAPTAVAAASRACRDQVASDPLPCPALVSVTGYDHGQRLDWLRSDPLRARITRKGTGFELELAGVGNATVPIRSTKDGLISKAGAATIIFEAMLTPGDHGRGLFLQDFFAHDVHYTMRFGTLTMDDGDRTIQLEAVAP